ncbi:MAG: MBOAT family O-acyltransferase, partial [Chloroflexota bacterium]
MAFNSIIYILFFPVVYLIYYFTKDKWRWVVLLAASLIFYAALNIPYLLLALAVTTLITYFFGILIDRQPEPRRKRFFWLGVTLNVLALVIMNYLPFLTSNLNIALVLISPALKIKVPPELVSIGVSFYVFQAISYLANIYLEIDKPEKHFGYFALFQSFFPKLLQGPIERPGLLEQLHKPYEFNYDNLRSGLLLFGWGLFKKTIIADRLAMPADTIFNAVAKYNGFPLIIAVLSYAFQIYFDFSGYTDMALGVARIFNIELTNNFKGPYLARSIADFWKRWHISFSSWILDYLFKPLQMQFRRLAGFGTALALMITFLLSGLWHGASWGFVIWGALHGFYMVVESFYAPFRRKFFKKFHLEKNVLVHIWQVISTFILVCFAWIFFRAKTTGDAFYIIQHFFTREMLVCGKYMVKYAPFLTVAPGNYPQLAKRLTQLCKPDVLGTTNLPAVLAIPYNEVVILGSMLAVYLTVTLLEKRLAFYQLPRWVRWTAYYLLIIIIILFEVPQKRAWFVYFQ